jgi:2-C-methyl-D-erythritol 4-phosphate cytidylyltransferase
VEIMIDESSAIHNNLDTPEDRPETAVYAIIPAAGSGSRMALGHNKQFLKLGRYPVIIRTLRIFEAHPLIDGFVVVSTEEETGVMRQLIDSFCIKKCLAVTAGGATRQESVARGLDLLASNPSIHPADLADSLILVHDGARCFVPRDVISRVIDGIRNHQACGAAIPVRDTIKQAGPDGKVIRTLVRDQLREMQTPQGAVYSLLRKTYDLAAAKGWQATDDCSLLEWAGTAVYLAKGDSVNIKLTTPEDRLLGEQLALIADQADGL